LASTSFCGKLEQTICIAFGVGTLDDRRLAFDQAQFA
jgi:hypothetical protein